MFAEYSKSKKETVRARSGFTLIETFVAIAILATALAGALALAAQGFNSADVAGDQITASFLAQDAMEYVRFLRDSATLAKNNIGWLAYVRNCIPSGQIHYCYFDSKSGIPNGTGNGGPTQCSPGTAVTSCMPVDYDSSTGFYNYTTGVATKFTRAVSVVQSNTNTDEVEVSVYVDWQSRGINRQVALQEDLLNWQP